MSDMDVNIPPLVDGPLSRHGIRVRLRTIAAAYRSADRNERMYARRA